MRKLLSALAVPKLGTGEYWDPLIPGLALRVGARRRTWTLRHRVGGRHRRDILGYFPTLSLADARTAAGKLLERVEAGAAPLPPPVHPRSALTLGALIDRYEALRQREGHRIKQLAPSMRALRVGLADYLSLPAAQFSKADLRAARDAIADRGTQIAANRLLGYLGPVFKWAAQEDLIPTNFVRDLRRAPERKRSHVLTDKEIAAIWHACDRRGEWPRPKLTGGWCASCSAPRSAGRRGLPQAWRHSRRPWKQADNKADRPHSLILPPLGTRPVGKGRARDACVRRRQRGSSRVFQAQTRARPGGQHYRLAAARFAPNRSDPMQALGIRNEIVQAVLNHAIPGVGGVYLRAELEKEKAEALRVWATELERITRKARAVS